MASSSSYPNEATITGVKCVVNLEVPEKLKGLNRDPNVFLAGGALVRLRYDQHDPAEIKETTYDPTKHDLDFFVVGDTPALREKYLREFVASLGGQVSRTNVSYVNVVQDDGTHIQVIMTEEKDIRKVVYRFDFSVCRLWLNKDNVVEGLMSSCPMRFEEGRRINENTVSRQIFVSRQRIDKYEKLFGFTTIVSPEVKLVDDEPPKATLVPMEEPFTPVRNGFKYE